VCDDLFDSKRRMVLSLFCLGAEVTLLLHVRVPATIFFAEDTDERRCLNAKNVFRLSICLIPMSPDFLSEVAFSVVLCPSATSFLSLLRIPPRILYVMMTMTRISQITQEDGVSVSHYLPCWLDILDYMDDIGAMDGTHN